MQVQQSEQLLVRQLTCDYIDLFNCILLSVKSQVGENEDVIDTYATHTGPPVRTVIELGKQFLAKPMLYSPLLECPTWILDPVLKYWAKLIPANSKNFEEVATTLMSELFIRIQLLGQRTHNLTEYVRLGVLINDTFLSIYSDLVLEVFVLNLENLFV